MRIRRIAKVEQVTAPSCLVPLMFGALRPHLGKKEAPGTGDKGHETQCAALNSLEQVSCDNCGMNLADADKPDGPAAFLSMTA